MDSILYDLVHDIMPLVNDVDSEKLDYLVAGEIVASLLSNFGVLVDPVVVLECIRGFRERCDSRYIYRIVHRFLADLHGYSVYAGVPYDVYEAYRRLGCLKLCEERAKKNKGEGNAEDEA